MGPTAAPAAVSVPLTVADRAYGAAAPLAFALAWMTARLTGASASELAQRCGRVPPVPAPPIWFHGASAGEIGAAITLARLLRQAGCHYGAAYTATNRAGVDVAARSLGHGAAQADVVSLAPWDAPRWVAHAFDTWQPRALFLLETELWPRLILEAYHRRVPIFCASARIYARDVAGYRAARPVIAPTLQRVTVILAQNAAERERFIRLGAHPERCVVAGNVKYAASADAPTGVAVLRREIGLADTDRVIVCGSVHADEVETVLRALDQLPAGQRLIVAPRQPAAAAVISDAARRRGWKVHQRTAGPPPPGWQLLVLDTVGELSRVYAMASVAVVGGGFGTHGGHNLAEPLQAGAPVLFGPHGDNFGEIAEAIAAATPEARVASADALARCLRAWLDDANLRKHVVAMQRAALPDGEAIGKRYLDALAPWLPSWSMHAS